jgi:hypothetical protein
MAQTNYTPIYLYNSGTATNTPLAANLGAGELAINYTDGKLFYKDNNAAIQIIGWKTTPTTAGGTGLTSYTAGDLPYYASGSALSKLGIGTANYVLTSSGTAPQYVAQSTLSVGSATNATNTAITDNTSSSATWYPTIVSATTGNLPQTTSSTKLSFVPSTGVLTATQISASQITSSAGNLIFSTSGTGIQGTTTNDNANAGVVGEYVFSAVSAGATVNLPSSGTFVVVTSISLTAGDWDVSGSISFATQSGTVTLVNYLTGDTSTNSGDGGTNGSLAQAQANNPNNGTIILAIPTYRYNITSTTTVYLNARASFTGTATYGGYGTIRARRVR